MKYAIRVPANDSLERDIAELLTRPVGRPSHKPVVWYKGFADSTSGNFMTKAIFPSLLREDLRYFQLGKGGFWRLAGYAVSCVFVTRTDSGNNRFNFSEIAGSATAAAISISYHATGERNLPNALRARRRTTAANASTINPAHVM